MAALAAPGKVSMRTLLSGLVNEAVPDMELESLSQSAQDMEPGGLYLALAGSRHHGLDFVNQAIQRGAVAVAWEPVAGRGEPTLPVGVGGIAVPGLRQLAGVIADRFYGEPSAGMRVAGITGTNGKTSCTFFVAQALEHLGCRCAVMGTLGAGRPGQLEALPLTTPDAVSVHRKLARLLAQEVRHIAMEVSSHALVQGRVNAVRMSCAVFTNLSQDHLDYHGNFAAYGEAKSALFTQHLEGTAVVNAGDPWGRRIMGLLPEHLRCIAIAPDKAGPRPAEWLAASNFEVRGKGLSFAVTGSFGKSRIDSQLAGEFNAENLLLALGVLLSWGFGFEQSSKALEKVRAPAGRMETFGGGRQPLVIVDFAHTPDALQKVLQAVRGHAPGKLILVFGCGGERDRGKRARMGAIAESLADLVVITDDNPREEDPDLIVADILSGITGRATVERDRAAAIEVAIAAAQVGDVVVVAGKGHETFQTTRAGKQPFSDREVVAHLLNAASAGGAA